MSRRSAPLALALALALGGGCAYSAGDYRHGGSAFSGHRDRVGCLDVAIERRPDIDARAVGGYAAVLGYRFGNGCDHPVRLDLGELHVFGVDAEGDRLSLRAFDPRTQIRVARLAGRTAGGEVLAYAAPRPLVEVCVEVTSFGALLPTTEPATRWVCLARDGAARTPAEGSVW